jgi:hypothetical protein
MMRKKHTIAVLAGAVLLLVAVFAFAQGEKGSGESYALEPGINRHPIKVEQATCTMCHPGKWQQMNHTTFWLDKHRFAAEQNERFCAICHEESYCADCHANKQELKPSDMYKQSPERSLPHPGDYLTQHQVDGRINPAPCFRCHGRTNNATCKRCHR